MTAIFDTSPLCYLVLIGHDTLAPALFGRCVIPSAVWSELSSLGAPIDVRRWIAAPPAWLEVQLDPASTVPGLEGLQAGERAVISLAVEAPGDLVVLDDRAARAAAQRLGLPIIGLIGLLDLAAERRLINLSEVLERLSHTSFRISAAIVERLKSDHAAG